MDGIHESGNSKPAFNRKLRYSCRSSFIHSYHSFTTSASVISRRGRSYARGTLVVIVSCSDLASGRTGTCGVVVVNVVVVIAWSTGSCVLATPWTAEEAGVCGAANTTTTTTMTTEYREGAAEE